MKKQVPRQFATERVFYAGTDKEHQAEWSQYEDPHQRTFEAASGGPGLSRYVSIASEGGQGPNASSHGNCRRVTCEREGPHQVPRQAPAEGCRGAARVLIEIRHGRYPSFDQSLLHGRPRACLAFAGPKDRPRHSRIGPDYPKLPPSGKNPRLRRQGRGPCASSLVVFRFGGSSAKFRPRISV